MRLLDQSDVTGGLDPYNMMTGAIKCDRTHVPDLLRYVYTPLSDDKHQFVRTAYFGHVKYSIHIFDT